MPANTKESGLKELIINALVKDNGYGQGANEDYNRDYAIDETRLFRFLSATQKTEMSNIGNALNSLISLWGKFPSAELLMSSAMG